MNRLILSLVLILCGCDLIAQEPEYVQTPNDTDVEVTRTDDSNTPTMKDNLSAYFDSAYPAITEVGYRSAAGNYNCHGYAWHMIYSSYNMNDPVIIDSPHVVKYWEDGSYEEVPAGFAQKIIYSPSGHSADVISSDTVRSKFGGEILGDHPISLLISPYGELTTWTSYSLPMTISQDEYFKTTPYQILNFQTGTSVTWTPGANMAINNDQGSSCSFIQTPRLPSEPNSSSITATLVRNGSTLPIQKSIILSAPPVIQISGPTLLCSSGGQYSISNVPSGATITWTPGPGVAMVSAQGSNPCTFMSTSSSSSYIQATLSRNGYVHTCDDYSIWSGPPPSPEITASNVSGGYGNYTTTINSGTAYFSMGSSVVNPFWDVSNATSSTSYPYNYYLDVYPNVVGENYITAYMDNSCGTSDGGYVYLEVTAGRAAMEQDSLSISLSPNPASQFVDIELVTWGELVIDSDYVIEFTDPYSRVVKQVTLSGTMNRVNIQDLQKGYYVVTLRYGKRISSAILLVE